MRQITAVKGHEGYFDRAGFVEFKYPEYYENEEFELVPKEGVPILNFYEVRAALISKNEEDIKPYDDFFKNKKEYFLDQKVDLLKEGFNTTMIGNVRSGTCLARSVFEHLTSIVTGNDMDTNKCTFSN